MDFKFLARSSDSQEAAEIYENILEKAIAESGVHVANAGSVNGPSTKAEIIPVLLSLNVPSRIINEAFLDMFSMKIFNFVEIKDFSTVVIEKDYIINEGTLFLPNPFAESVELIKRNLSLYESEEIIVNDIGIISTENLIEVQSLRLDLELARIDTSKIVNELELEYFLSNIISEALDSKTSYIHFTPTQTHIKISYRIDGKIIESPFKLKPDENYTKLFELLTNLASIDDVSQAVGSGKFVWGFKGNSYSIMLNYTMIDTGSFSYPSILLRVFNFSDDFLCLNKLGFSPSEEKKLISAITAPSGLFVVSGSSDAGKSSTVYSIINYLKNNYQNRSIYSLEKIVELQIDGVSQIHVPTGFYLEYLNKMQNLDANVIVVSDIKNPEDIRGCFELAADGKMVILSMSAKGIMNSISYFLSLGLSPSMIAETYVGGCHQALLSRVCQSCSTEYKFFDDINYKRYYNLTNAPRASDKIRKANPDGCPQCTQGYDGRTLTYEVIEKTQSLKENIESGFNIQGAKIDERSNGWNDIFETSIILIKNHITTISDLESVVGRRELKK